jgi:hypothetical protein
MIVVDASAVLEALLRTSSARTVAILLSSPRRRCPDNKSARCAPSELVRQATCEQKQKSERRGLVSVTEKTRRISRISRSHAGSRQFWKRAADIDRRRHHRGGDPAVDADHGGGHAIRGNRESDRRDGVAGRPAHRQRLQMPGPGTRQGLLRGRDRDRKRRGAGKAVIPLARGGNPGARISRIGESGYIAARCPAPHNPIP